ncbi:MAG: N-acetylmuramoyl-L-alanine amidase family protein [Bacillota bacterium]|nr:N-acetylmuramoyl-L-alanine amidase family protein [Bacillota bacterium]
MRHAKRLLFVMIVVFVFTGAALAEETAEYATADLTLDGAAVETDMPPVILEGRTLIPARALFEGMGGEVLWDGEARMVTILWGSYRIQLTIDSTTAFVNGAQETLDVPATIINDRTLIPVRFVAEAIGCTVDWDPETRTVMVTSPESQEFASITSVTLSTTETGYRITVTGEDMIGTYKATAYEEPDRFGVDIYNALLVQGVGSLTADNEIFQSVRFSQFDGETVRIVVDLLQKQAGTVSLSEGRTALYIDFPSLLASETGGGEEGEEGEEGEGEDGETQDDDSAGPPEELDALGLPELDWRMGGKLIAIDVGHGGSDVGAQGYVNGVAAVDEKDLNLSVALRLHELLELAGANVVLLRDEDVYMSLYSRPEAANAMNADLLVSIHNNSADNTAANGTEVLYYAKKGEELYGYTSETIATWVHQELLESIGLADRGVKSSPHLAVLNKSLMPAIIIEGAFLSNEGDLAHMMREEYIEEYALGAARGIIKALNASTEQ